MDNTSQGCPRWSAMLWGELWERLEELRGSSREVCACKKFPISRSCGHYVIMLTGSWLKAHVSWLMAKGWAPGSHRQVWAWARRLAPLGHEP